MRKIINKLQEANTKTYYFNGRPINFNKNTGYLFSDHPAMDDCVNYFLGLDGFELVSSKKNEQSVQTPKKEEKVVVKESKPFFQKKDKKEVEMPKEE